MREMKSKSKKVYEEEPLEEDTGEDLDSSLDETYDEF